MGIWFIVAGGAILLGLIVDAFVEKTTKKKEITYADSEGKKMWMKLETTIENPNDYDIIIRKKEGASAPELTVNHLKDWA